MSLPASWVDALFDRLSIRYGSAWVSLWNGIDASLVKADWAAELAGFGGEAIKHALDHLPPDRPPTVGQFRALCLNRPDATKALPPPAQDPEVAARALAAIKPSVARPALAWARELRKREMACERLSVTQRAMWREALKHEAASA